MSGSGTSLFAVGSGDENIDVDAFPAAFAADVSDSLGVDVSVWRTGFLERGAGWYPGQ